MSTEIELKEHLGTEQQEEKPKIKFETLHPFVFIFYIVFKVAPIFCYLFIFYIFSKWFIICFSLTLFCLAIDFWYTKNIAGRLLCGLRWWNKVHDDGKSEWLFECLSNEKRVRLSKFEVYAFWIGLFVSNIFWVLCTLTCTLSFQPRYLVLVIIGVILQTTNTVGFVMCYNTQMKDIKKHLVEKAKETVIQKGVEIAMDQLVNGKKSTK